MFDLHVISLGAGVQSTTMALMAAHGEIEPMPDCAIFADTGWEPQAVYEHLDWLSASNVVPFPVHRVSAGNIREDTVEFAARGRVRNAKIGRAATMPFYVETASSGGGKLRRQCTRHYKIEPIERQIRELLGLAKGQRAAGRYRVDQWLGISTDEATRMKPSRTTWITNRWPLIEAGMSRRGCMSWLERHEYPLPPKSACIGCPYHDNAAWREMKLERPSEFADAVEIDELARHGFVNSRDGLYLHRSRMPLRLVDFSTLGDRGQLNLFENECEGMCGV